MSTMNRRRAFQGLLAACLGLGFTSLLHGQAAVLIDVGESWQYFKGTEAPPVDWNTIGFDDTGWLSGGTGIGYGDGDDLTELTDMMGGYVAFFARKSFTVADAGAISTLLLEIDFDDGYVAYLNGVEVDRIGLGAAGDAVAFDQLATGREAGTPLFRPIATTGLVAGTNVLAIELHNTLIDSTDASLIPRLLANSDQPPTGLGCTRGVGSNVLTWTNNGTYDSIDVLRNGQTIATVGGAELTYTDASPSVYDNSYRITASSGGLDLPPTPACLLPCTQGVLTCQLSVVGGFTQADLSWTGVTDVASVEIFREGALSATLTAGETTYQDPNVESLEPELDTDFRVVIHRNDGETCTLTCLLPMCPTLQADVVGESIVLTIGNNVRNWDHFELSRDGVVIEAALPAATTSYTDATAVLASGVSYDYVLHPVSAVGSELPDPMDQCDVGGSVAYVPEVGAYTAPAGGWDYILDFNSAADAKYNANVGEVGNLDGLWIRSIDRDLWDGHRPDEATGPAPAGPAPGGLDVVTRTGLGSCGSGDVGVLRILDPGNTGAPIGTAFPDAFVPASNSRIVLGLDLGITDRNVLRSGITLAARLRLSPDHPEYMNANPASGDGAPIATGIGMVGVYYKDTGVLPGEGATAGAAFGLNSAGNGGNLEVSTEPLADIDGVRALSFISVWMTVVAGANAGTYDVQVYVNGSSTPSSEVSVTGATLQAGMADFGPNVVNYLIIGSNDTGNDSMFELDYVAYKVGVFAPTSDPCEPVIGGDGFHRGDADDNGQLQLTDAVRILGFLFLGGAAPTCLDAGDADDNGQLQLTDAVRILGFLFLGGPAPAAPGPPGGACGPDPSEDAIGCASYTHC